MSLLGDGAFIVALAWQVYQLSDAPTAMGMVGIAMTVPTIAFLLVGGALSDRLNRRHLMLAADIARLLAAAALAALGLTGALEIWHVAILVAVYGTGQAFFAPCVRRDRPRPGAARPARAGQRARPARPPDRPAHGRPRAGRRARRRVRRERGLRPRRRELRRLGRGAAADAPAGGVRRRRPAGSVVADLREGWRFVRERRWLWVTFASAAIAYLLFMGPVEVLVPYVVKHDLGATASDLGLIFGAGGLASILTAMVMGQLGLPRRSMTFIYVAWTVATIAVAGYGLGTAVWHLMLASAVFNALETAGTIVWITAKQQHVPAGMLGRVSSLDWLISIGLLPLSFALTGPVSELVGAQTTLVLAGLAGAAVTLGGLLVPGVRSIEDPPSRDAVRTADAYAA